MRNFKKTLVVICVLALLAAGCVFTALAVDVGVLSDLNALVAAAEAETDAIARYNALVSVDEYLDSHTFNTAEDGYDAAIANANAAFVNGAVALLNNVKSNTSADNAYDYMMKADALLEMRALPEETLGFADAKAKYDATLVKTLQLLVEKCDAKVETNLKTATNGITVKKVNSVLAYCAPFGDASVLDSVLAQFETLEAAQERAEQKNYSDLDASNRLTNYELPIFFTEDWEACKVGLDSTNLTGRWTVDLKGISNRIGILQEDNGNKYMIHRYLEKDNPQSSYTQIGLSSHNVTNENGLVFEFDITTFNTVPDQGVTIETGSVAGAYFPPCYFHIDNRGNICTNDKSTVALEGAIVKGEWTHIVIVLEPSEFVYNLYVDGQFICTYDAKYEGKTRYDHRQVAFRISGGKGTSGEIAVDNLQIYGGDCYRIHDRLETMTEDEKFLYYVSYLTNEKNAVSERSVAYNTAKSLIDKYWVVDENGEGTYTEYTLSNPAMMDAVDIYTSFDLESFLYEVGIRNLDSYIALVESLISIERNASTATQRKDKISEIVKFVNTNVDLINRDADRDNNGKSDFYEYDTIVTRITREANYDGNAADFIRFISRFEKATTLSAKQRNYNKAVELAENDGIDISLILDETTPGRENFKDLIAAYDVYRNADKVIYELTLSNNSSKIIKCIARINCYTTEEEWLENREFMEEYLFLLKDVVFGTDENGNLLYDPNVEGVEEALEFFHASYSYFYAILQTEHVEYIQDRLDRIAATDAYIEKMGMTASIEKYLEVNDIDYEDDRIILLLNNLDTCKAELQLREADYAKLLIQNAVYFTNLVERMRTAQTYNEQKAYFEEAYLLYFNIDITVEGTARAVEIFDEYKINLDRIAESSVKFLEAVAVYKACETEDEKYAALVECYYNAQFVEMSYDGAEEAMAEYLEAYDAYMSYAEAVNEDITNSANAVGSLRSNCGITNIISIVIKKLFGN